MGLRSTQETAGLWHGVGLRSMYGMDLLGGCGHSGLGLGAEALLSHAREEVGFEPGQKAVL